MPCKIAHRRSGDLKYGTYANDKDECTAHFIRTIVLKEIILGELNKMISFVKENEDEFVQAAMDNSIQKQSSELTKSRKKQRSVSQNWTGCSQGSMRTMYQGKFPMSVLL